MRSLTMLAPLMGSLTAAAPLAPRANNTGCNTLAVNSGALVPGDGSITAYLHAADFHTTAQSAPTPFGYTKVYAYETGSEQNPETYLTYFTLNSTYDTKACATHCNADPKCTAFNIYFARDPKYELTTTCTNPPPVTNIRCALFAEDVAESAATNKHQYATAEYGDTFERVALGSNGYNKLPPADLDTPTNTTAPPAFYLQDDLGDSAIQADAAYMTVHLLPPSTASPESVCASHCAAAHTFNKQCVFFNTYTQLVNGVNELGGTKCALFAKAFGREWATNRGSEGVGARVTVEGSRTWSLGA